MTTHKNIKENQIVKAFYACKDGLIRSIMKLSASQDDVDDILQETFLRVYEVNERTRIASPQDYLFVVSRNLVLKKLSQQSREVASEIDDALLEDEESSIEMQLHYRKKFESLNDVLQRIPENHRRAILLRKFYGLSHKEIANKMNVSVSSVEKYISAGMKRCKQHMYSTGYDDRDINPVKSQHSVLNTKRSNDG